MIVISDIMIRNYGGIDDISWKPAAINVLIGPNNSGKSDVLEAIALQLTCNREFVDELGTNIIEYLLSNKGYDPNYIIKIDKERADITTIINKTRYELNIEYHREGFGKGASAIKISNYFEKLMKRIITKIIESAGSTFQEQLDTILETAADEIDLEEKDWEKIKDKITRIAKRKYRVPYELDIQDESLQDYIADIRQEIMEEIYSLPKVIFYSKKSKGSSGIAVYINSERKFHFKSPRIFPRTGDIGPYVFYEITTGFKNIHYVVEHSNDTLKIPIMFNYQRMNMIIDELLDRVVELGKIDAIISLLKENGIASDIRKTKRNIMVFTKFARKPVPLSSMGDGFIALLRMLFLVSMVDKGIILFEEPEISLHPYYSRILTNEMIKHAKNTQIFLSTHSIDFLEDLLENAKKQQKLDDIRIIRFHYRNADERVSLEVLNGEEAMEEIEAIGTDLRIT